MAEHEWVPSTLGHGEMMCKHCLVTNREAWVLGSECSANEACTLPEQSVNVVQNVDDMIAKLMDDMIAKLKAGETVHFHGVVQAPYERPRGKVRCEDVPPLDDVEQVLSRVEVLLDTWALLLDNHPVIEGDDAPDGLHDMSWVAVAAITRLRDELLLRADKLREPNDG